MEVVKKERNKEEGRKSDYGGKGEGEFSGEKYTTNNSIIVPAKPPPSQNVKCKCTYIVLIKICLTLKILQT